MKILLINDFKTGGGAEVVFNQTYKAFLEEGFDVDMLYCHDSIQTFESVVDFFFSYKSYKRLNEYLNNGKYDLIYLLNYAYAFSPSILFLIKKYKKKNPKLNVIYNAHDFHIICPNSHLAYFKNGNMRIFSKYPPFLKMMSKTYDHRGHLFSFMKKVRWLIIYKLLGLHKIFDTVLCPSIFLANKIQEAYPYLNVEILRNPLDINKFIRKNIYNYTQGPLRLVYFGRLSTEKGLYYLIKSLGNVESEYEFHIYGDGPEKDSLIELVNKNNLYDRVKFKGKLDWKDLMNKLSEYDAFILTSISNENAPLSIVEAAAAGLFVITMNYAGMQELGNIVGNSYLMDSVTTDNLNNAFYYVKSSQHTYPDLSMFSEEKFKKDLVSYIEKV